MIVYIDMDDVLCDFTGAKEIALSRNSSVGFPQSQYGFYQKLNPLPGAIDAVSMLIASEKI